MFAYGTGGKVSVVTPMSGLYSVSLSLLRGDAGRTRDRAREGLESALAIAQPWLEYEKPHASCRQRSPQRQYDNSINQFTQQSRVCTAGTAATDRTWAPRPYVTVVPVVIGSVTAKGAASLHRKLPSKIRTRFVSCTVSFFGAGSQVLQALTFFGHVRN